MKKEEILNKLKELKPIYQQEGLEIVGLFRSYAKDTQTEYSDIDIAYKLNYEEFSKRYIGGFSKLLRIDSIKDELKSMKNLSRLFLEVVKLLCLYIFSIVTKFIKNLI